jgi:hypothetical protein
MSKTANKWTIESVKLSEVTPFKDNPRTIKSKQFAILRKSLERFGYVDLIVWNKRTGNIVGGHQRYKILMEQGIKEAKMIAVDMSESEELAANITLNNPSIEGDWDDPINELLGHLESYDPEFFVDANFDSLREAVENMPIESIEEDTECPCCKHRWSITQEDITVLSIEEQDALVNGEYVDGDDG